MSNLLGHCEPLERLRPLSYYFIGKEKKGIVKRCRALSAWMNV